ncbi:unnamed protein product [Phaeothamnion confervicola]
MSAAVKRWEAVCKKVRDERDSKEHFLVAEKKAGIANGREREDETDAKVASMSAGELQAAMRSGELTCEAVCRVFCSRSHNIGLRKLNCVTEEFYDEALEEARRLDCSGELRRAEDPTRPLLGLPISIKDSITQGGARTTCGMASLQRYHAVDQEDGLLVSLIRAAGGIPFVRTNTPQCLMMSESQNAIYGRSDNPWDEARTVGGSSGGEAGLIAARCSPLGLGSDIGGSIRIPAHFCGISALKPTPERITRLGLAALRATSQGGIKVRESVVAGPMANSVGDLDLMMRALLAPMARECDPYVPPGTWDVLRAADGPGRKLRIGVFHTDRWFEPCTACKRAVHETAAALEAAGHYTEPFELPADGWEVARLYYGQMAAEGNMHGFVAALEGEPLLPVYSSLKFIADLPNFVRPAVAAALGLRGEKRRASMFRVTRDGGISAREYWGLTTAQMHMCRAFAAALATQKLDVLLFPAVALPAWQHGGSTELTPSLTYTFLANLLHWPAGVVPVTRVRADEQEYPLEALPGDQRDGVAGKAALAMAGSAGMPVGVQLMAPPFEDELVVYAMRQVRLRQRWRD